MSSPPADSDGAARAPGAGNGAAQIANPRRVARNAMALGFSRVWAMISYAVWLGIVNRGLGAAVMGEMYAILSFITIVTIIPAMGMDQALVRLTARKQENAPVYLGVAIVMRNLLSVIAIAIVVVVALLSHWERHIVIATFVACGWILADLSLMTNYAVYLAFEKSHYETGLTLLYNTLNIPVTVIALHMGWGLIGVFAAMSAANVFTMMLGWIITTRRFVKPVLRWEPALLKEMLHLTFTIGFARSTRMFYNRIDIMLLLALVPGGSSARFIAVGIYDTASQLVRKAVTFQQVFARPLLPVASRAVDQPELLKTLHRTAFRVLLMVSVGACGTVLASSSFLVHALTGHRFHEFAPAVPLLGFLSVLLLTTYASSSARVVIVALKMQNFLLTQSIIMVAINFVLDVVLIRAFAPRGLAWWGPAIASLVAELYLTTVIVTAVSRRVRCGPELGSSLRILLAGVIMAGAGLLAASVWRPLPLVVSPAVYVVAIFALRVVRRREIAALLPRRALRGPLAGLARRPLTPAEREAEGELAAAAKEDRLAADMLENV